MKEVFGEWQEKVFLMNDLYKQFTVGIEEEYMICNPKDDL